MRLHLMLAGKVIATVPLDKEKWNSTDYVQAKRRLLSAVYASTISVYAEQPVFYIEVASAMNNPAKRKTGKEPGKLMQATR